MKNIFLIVGPSGSGKSSVSEAVANNLGLKLVNSYTDRPRRSENETGHIFLSKEEFDKLGNFCAYTEFNGYRYGVTKDIIEESDIYIIDPNGVEFFLREYKGNKKPVVIGLTVKSKAECKKRMLARGDSEHMVESRLFNDDKEFNAARMLSICDYLIKNDDFDHTVAIVEQIIQNLNKKSSIVYAVNIHYEGGWLFHVNAANEDEAREIAENEFGNLTSDALINNLADSFVDDVYPVNSSNEEE